MGRLLQDARYGIRSLLSHREFSAAAILALAMGIGANTAIFSIAYSVLLRPLPYPHSPRIMTVWQILPKAFHLQNDWEDNSAADFAEYRNGSDAFERISAFGQSPLNLEGRDQPERLAVTFATPGFFEILGARTQIGREFLPEEYQAGHNQEIILSYKLWRRQFGADRSIIGQSVVLSGASYKVVGVMWPGFEFPRQSDLPPFEKYAAETDAWVPWTPPADQISKRQGSYCIIALLKSDKTLRQAQDELNTIEERSDRQNAEWEAGYRVAIVPLKNVIGGNIKLALTLLVGTAGLVLLIACANVANLLLARSVGRRKEIAVRAALGASRLQIVRQMLTESVLLSSFGGVLGLTLAFPAIKLLVALAPRNIPRIQQTGIDWTVLAVTAAIALLTGVVFGLLPAIHASRPDLNESLKEGTRGSTTAGSRLRDSLVIAEVAIALVLLLGTGLMMRSMIRLYSVDRGYDADNVLIARVNLPYSRYPTWEKSRAFYLKAIERLRTLPGVIAVGGSTTPPIAGAEGFGNEMGFWIEGQPVPNSVDQFLATRYDGVTVDYFRTMRIPLLRGREFTEADNKDAPQVVVVNQAFARRFFPGQDPIGRRINQGAPFTGGILPWQTIVGVVADTKNLDLTRPTDPELYVSYLQRPVLPLAIVLRTAASPDRIAAGIREEIRNVDKDAPAYEISTMNQIIARTVSQRRFSLSLFSLFALVALLLASIGVYGVTSFLVTQQTHEIGIRMTLGATKGHILRAVVGRGMVLALAGIALGVAVGFGLTHLIASLLFGVSTTDPLTFVGTSVLISIVALIANSIPALRAARVDPLTALRYE